MKSRMIAIASVGSVLGVGLVLFGLQPHSPMPTPTAEVPQASVTTRSWPQPPPTEHWLEDGKETENKLKRKAWFREMHKTADGTDYREIERANGLAQIDKRNALSQLHRNRRSGPQWMERGSQNQAGRMHVTQFSSDGSTLYAGSAMGGIWRQPVEGGEWTQIGDNLYGGAHWLAVLPPLESDEPDIVLAATDWGWIHRTDDDGDTWDVPEGIPWLDSIRRVITTSDESRTLFVLAGASGAYKLYRSTDGGENFEPIVDLGNDRGDLWTPRDGDSTLYLLSADHVLVSADFGDNWTQVGSLGVNARRAELVGSEAGAPTLYAVTRKSGTYTLHRSDDAGVSWQALDDVTDYWSSLAASMHDPDLFAWGGVELHVSRDGGESFAVQNAWHEYYGNPAELLHADIPGIDVLPDPVDDGERWFISTDGGLYHSTDSLQTVENLSLDGLRVSQYYSTHTSSANPNHVAAGSQDQGYQRTETDQPSVGPYTFVQHISGDYGHITSSDGTHEYLYTTYPGYILIQIGEDTPEFSGADFPSGERSAWIPPIVAHPDNPTVFFFCATRLYVYGREGIGGDWEVQSVSDQSFDTFDGEYISALEFSPFDSNKAWLATNYGRVFYSVDKAQTWTESESVGPYSHYLYGHALLASPSDPDTVYLGGSGYEGSSVYRSVDGGLTWSSWDTGLPQTMVYSLGEAPDGSGLVFAGTETAAYQRAPGDTYWEDITRNEAPVTIYWSVEALAHENTMRFGTYGRGIWDYQLDPTGDGCFPVRDLDEDGVLCDEDCDDKDPDVYPGAEEVCDGKDTNCIEDDLAEDDVDQDGFRACNECNDNDADISPSATEICGNGVDEDCDGVDEECEIAAGCGCGASPVQPALLFVLLPWLLRRRQPPARQSPPSP